MVRADDDDPVAPLRLSGLGLGALPASATQLPDHSTPQRQPDAVAARHRGAPRPPGWLEHARTLLRLDLAAPGGRALGWLAAVCLGCLLVTGYLLLHPRGRASDPTVPDTLPAAAAVPSAPPGIVVDVGGRVRHPGLVTLPVGS